MSPSTLPQDAPGSPGVTLQARLGPFTGRLHRAAWSPDGRFLAVPGAEHRLRVLAFPSLKVEREWPIEGPAWNAAFSPDGRWLAIGQPAAQVACWKWQAGLARQWPLGSRTSAATALFLGDGNLVTGSGKGRLYFWDMALGTLLRPKVEAHDKAIYALALAPSGGQLAVAAGDATLSIWSVSQCKKVNELPQAGPLYAAAWSPDGRWLAAGSADSAVRVWDQEDYEWDRTLSGHGAAVVGVSFSADGRLLASKSLDGTVRLWRTDRWETVAILPATADDRNPFGLLAFHPREAVLAGSGDGDRALNLWAIDTEKLLASPSPRPVPSKKKTATPPPQVAAPKPARRSVFVSYSHKDGTWLKRLRTVLAPLTRDGKVEWWDDSKIPAGAKWREEIESALAATKVAVLLVSPDFLESPFIVTAEIPPLFKAAQEEGVTLLWVHLRPCLWKRTPIAEYQAAHDVSRPLAGLSKAKWEAELVRIADEIEAALAKS